MNIKIVSGGQTGVDQGAQEVPETWLRSVGGCLVRGYFETREGLF